MENGVVSLPTRVPRSVFGFLVISAVFQKSVLWTIFPSSYNMRINELREFMDALGLALFSLEYFYWKRSSRKLLLYEIPVSEVMVEGRR